MTGFDWLTHFLALGIGAALGAFIVGVFAVGRRGDTEP